MKKLVIILSSLMLWNCSAIDDGSPSGQSLYTMHCAGCHGADGIGIPNITTIDIRGKNAAAVTDAINTEPSMAALTILSSSELKSIANYLAELFFSTTSNLSSAQFLKGLVAPTEATPLEVTLKDSSGIVRIGFTDPSTSEFSIDISDLTEPFLIKTTSIKDGRTFYSFSMANNLVNVTPLTDMMVRAAAPTNIDIIYGNCQLGSTHCFNSLTPTRIANAKAIISVEFASKFEKFNIDTRKFDVLSSIIQFEQSSYHTLLSSLESSRKIGCTNPLNPHGYIYDDDTTNSCFHDDDIDYDGFHDNI